MEKSDDSLMIDNNQTMDITNRFSKEVSKDYPKHISIDDEKLSFDEGLTEIEEEDSFAAQTIKNFTLPRSKRLL